MMTLALVASTIQLATASGLPSFTHVREPAVLGAPLPDNAPAHLAIALRLSNEAALDQLLAAQQDPRSDSYHRWLTPAEFGARFGQSAAAYQGQVTWLEAQGFHVVGYPNRTFIEATGTAGMVRRLLGVQLHWADMDGRRFRSFSGTPSLPEDIGAQVLSISGLDTRIHLRHHITASQGTALGASDLRAFYDMGPLIAGGNAAGGLVTAVIGTQEQDGPPSTGDISYYYQNVSNATAVYTPDSLPNPNGDYDSQGANEEYELDVEMQSVGAPNASAINLVLSPASEVFSTGVNYAVSTLSSATVVSLSLGICEPDLSGSSETSTAENYVKQGLSEGQTWFAASGDSGADDCGGGGGGGGGFGGGGGGGSGATVDFPADLPEIVAMGGTSFAGTPNWNSSNAITDYQTETTWNDGTQGGAGGGGVSTLFAEPSYQQGISPDSSGRGVPDLALFADPSPGVAADVSGNAGELDPIGGTSVASPLAAGIFALLSGQKGCKLGDVHATLYQLGKAQQGGGAAPFHDITTGNNTYDGITGFSAGPGYDLATGWGSLDVSELVASWPSCNGTVTTSNTGTSTGGVVTGGSSTGAGIGTSTGGVFSGSSTGGTTGGTPGGSSTGGRQGSNSGQNGGSSTGGSTTNQGTGPANGGSSTGGESGSGPLVSSAKPIPITPSAEGEGCGTGVGSSGLAAWLAALLMLARRRLPSLR